MVYLTNFTDIDNPCTAFTTVGGRQIGKTAHVKKAVAKLRAAGQDVKIISNSADKPQQ